MNRTNARKIAETITNDQLQEMFDRAKREIKDWTKVSTCNKGFTKGVAWNILAKDFDINHNHHIVAKTNMIHEFGEFLPDLLKPEKHKGKLPSKPPIHQDPIFE